MSLSFIGPAGACEFHWIRFALLRDTVLHHFDGGEMTPAFSALYAAGQALGGQTVTVSALKLREEAERAQALCQRPVWQLAISARTKAVIHLEEDLPIGPPTQVVGISLSLPWLTGGELRTLGDVFGGVVAGLMKITEDAAETDTVDIIDT